MKTTEEIRLEDHYSEKNPWLKWGPYLSERQWGTVREDYSPGGDAWQYFTHDQARSRVYRWGEDGLAGISDDQQMLCFAIALWNGKDPILKERLFGVNAIEGNHGEDVKELYYYLDSSPTHSYMKHLYKYPQKEYPYEDLVGTNQSRNRNEPEYELTDTGIFAESRYFDVYTEYAKQNAEDILIKITIHNRGPESAPIAVMPTLWFRNLWSFGGLKEKPILELQSNSGKFGQVLARHAIVGEYHFYFEKPDRVLFTENETNVNRLFGVPNPGPYVKDAFHEAVIHSSFDDLSDNQSGTKCSPLYQFDMEAGASVQIKLRLSKQQHEQPFPADFEKIFGDRLAETDQFYANISSENEEQRIIQRQAYAGMLWSKQYYYIDIPQWLKGDPGYPPPPEERKSGRNSHWKTLNNADIISMPDKWEYPWYAAWDLAFHCIPLARLDSRFAKEQLILLLREWYMHPNGQLPAYEWSFGDVNPPVHAWSCLEVYKMDREKTGKPDYKFLERVFHKLLLNFTWWVNRKDQHGKNVFEGGFLGLDNIGIFDRSGDIPGGGTLEQADGTAWMGMYSLNMLEIALELSQNDDAYEDVATKFFEHFVYIAESLNQIRHDWTGAWNEEEGFFYDVLSMPDGRYMPLKVRSLVGLTTLFGVLVIKKDMLKKVPAFYNRLKWFRNYRQKNNEYQVLEDLKENDDILLSLIPRVRLERMMVPLLDEDEFLSPGGIRSLSKIHSEPYQIHINGESFGLDYQPGESTSPIFGGNSNWRGPVWMPMNYLIILSLRKYCDYYRGKCTVHYPANSEASLMLSEVSVELSKRLLSLFLPDENKRRPIHDAVELYKNDPYFSDLVLFYEYFDGDTGRGVGASHQTGWTGLIAEIICQLAARKD